MAKYTVELRELIDSGFNIGLDDYPIFNESYRETLNGKIEDHYLFNEIGFETPERFSLQMAIKMNEIMPIFNKIYESELIDIQPLLDYQRNVSRETTQNKDTSTDQEIDNTSTVDNTTNTTSSSEANNNSNINENVEGSQSQNVTQKDDVKTINIGSDTPQSELLIGDVESNLFASEAKVDNVDGTNVSDSIGSNNQDSSRNETSLSTSDSEASNISDTDSTSNTTTTATSLENLLNIESTLESGFNQSQVDLLIKWRQSFIDVDMMIIAELEELFMGVY